MTPKTHTGATLVMRVAYESGDEKTIGFVKNLTFSVVNGQKVTYGVDSVLPVEIAQGASASFVKGSMNIFLPKGSTVESLGLVPHRQKSGPSAGDVEGGTQSNNIAALSKYMHIRIYDRSTQNLVLSADYCKIGSYTFGVSAKGLVEVSLQFDGIYATPGFAI